jgi:predicted transport protein
MSIFSDTNGILTLISEVPFDLEKDLQKVVEDNMKTVLGIDIVTSQLQLFGLRVDSLGFNQESKSFTIIEYKKDRNYSVIDQGYAYLGLLLNNKAEFTLKYQECTNKSLKKEDVDWSQSRVIFISPEFTTYQRKAIEFKNLPIELWEVKRYSNNTILVNQIQTPEQSESITVISQNSEIVKKVSQEVKVYAEESHLDNTTDDIKALYTELKDHILNIGSNIVLKPKAKYIAFFHKGNFVDIVVRKSNLTLYLNIKKGLLNDPKKMSRDVSNVGHWGNGDYEIVVKQTSDIGYVLSLIRQSYDTN